MQKTCAAPDKISTIFLTKCKFVLAIPLLLLFNKSFMSGIFPDKWKVNHISPISKGGDISRITNYPPISMTSIIPKIFERIVFKIKNPLFKNIIVDEQHGFISGRTTTNLLIFQDYNLGAFKSGHQVGVVFTDFSKALTQSCQPIS